MKQINPSNDMPSPKLNSKLLDLFTSRTRLKVLNVFIPRPDEMFYVRQVTRLVDEEVNAVRRELERLKSIGLLTTEKRANRLYYKVRREFEFYYDLLRMIGKTTGLGLMITEKAEAIGRINYLMLSSRFVQQTPPGPNDIDVLLVGRVDLEKLQAIIRQYEEQVGHEVNYTVMTQDEFEFRKKRNDAFIRSVLAQPQVVVIGDEVELNK